MSEDIKVTDGTVLESLNNKVDMDFQNVATNSVGFTRCSTEVTNCITEIPQRIKLELNNGVLTLKAGSEVIVPNGFEADGTTPKFDYATVENDLSASSMGNATQSNDFLMLNVNNFTFQPMAQACAFSGTTAPTSATYLIWYDTANNLVKYSSDTGSTWKTGFSLPIALFSRISGVPKSINNLFNGISYIGSTVWVDKGIKGLIPNGRNEDGTLNNIEFETSKISVTSTSSDESFDVFISEEGLKRFSYPHYEQDATPSTTYLCATWYSPSENILRYTNDYGATWIKANWAKAFRIVCSNRKITSLKSKQPFRALDYNDKPEIASWAMPSNKYIDLTLGASGSTYKAPANGWFTIAKRSTAANQFIHMAARLGTQVWSSGTNQDLHVHLPCKKGLNAVVNYTVGGSTNVFRFIYAEDEV